MTATSPVQTALPEIASLWIGERLGFIEQMAALSFLEHGHRFTLFTTEAVQGIPPGVEVRDANEIFPCQPTLRDRKSGSPALHADMFRYAMLAQTDFLWVDMDVLCMRPFIPQSDYIFGLEDAQTVNNAVLRLPKSSPTLQALLEYQPETRGYPPFFSRARRIKYWLKHGGHTPGIRDWPWGSIGPKGLSHHLQANGEWHYAQAQACFYPIGMAQVARFTQAGGLSREELPAETHYVHLWNKQLCALLRQHGLAPESFLSQEKQRLAKVFDFRLHD